MFYSIPPKMKVSRKGIRWCSPVFPMAKLKFDGPSRSNLGLSGVGLCLRYFYRRLILVKAIALLSRINNLAKAFALLYGIQNAF